MLAVSRLIFVLLLAVAGPALAQDPGTVEDKVLPPLEQPAAMTDATARPRAIVIGRLRPLVLLMGFPPRTGW